MELTPEEIRLVNDREWITFHKEYSGRYMYGDKTMAISGSPEAIRDLKDDLIDEADSHSLSLLKKINHANKDNLGFDIILY